MMAGINYSVLICNIFYHIKSSTVVRRSFKLNICPTKNAPRRINPLSKRSQMIEKFRLYLHIIINGNLTNRNTLHEKCKPSRDVARVKDPCRNWMKNGKAVYCLASYNRVPFTRATALNRCYTGFRIQQ